MPHKKKVLSIDGGGIRGIIPAVVLTYIETRTGKRISELFDLIAGTSTGGILALALALRGEGGSPKYTAEDLIDLYVKGGEEIFPPGKFPGQRFLRNLANPKYSAKGLERILKDRFRQAKMGDALTDVMVTAYNIDRSTAWFFKSHRVKTYPERNCFVWEVARATAAAPTYFSPAKVYTVERDRFHPAIDGGVFANNPAMCAYVEALTQYKVNNDEVLLVSLGTGEAPRPIRYSKAKRWGLLQWAPPMLGVVFDGVSDTVDYQLGKLLDRYGNYYRFQKKLDREGSALDDVNSENLRLLRADGEEIVTRDRTTLDALCKRLVE